MDRRCDVYVAEDGPSGIAFAAEHDLDVILLDWMMPGMDGIEVLARLKKNAKTRHVPVIMLTSKDRQCDIGLAALEGITDYIVKPFNASNIGTLVMEKLKNLHAEENKKKKFNLKKVFLKIKDLC